MEGGGGGYITDLEMGPWDENRESASCWMGQDVA